MLCLSGEGCKKSIIGRELYMCLVDLEKAFDREPRKCWNGQ